MAKASRKPVGKVPASKARSAKTGKFTVVSRRIATPGVTTLVVGKKDARVERRAGAGTVIEQSVYGRDGRLKTVLTVDAGSATLGSDLQYAFEKSVAKARRENKKKFGSADPVIGRR